MADTHDKYKTIYRLYREGLTIRQIARRPVDADLCLKTVRNIIYRLRKDPHAPSTPRQQAIYALYLEGLDREGLSPAKAIIYACEHQPPTHVSMRTIREAIASVQERHTPRHLRPGSRAKAEKPRER